jgi:hypothetical protein
MHEAIRGRVGQYVEVIKHLETVGIPGELAEFDGEIPEVVLDGFKRLEAELARPCWEREVRFTMEDPVQFVSEFTEGTEDERVTTALRLIHKRFINLHSIDVIKHRDGDLGWRIMTLQQEIPEPLRELAVQSLLKAGNTGASVRTFDSFASVFLVSFAEFEDGVRLTFTLESIKGISTVDRVRAGLNNVLIGGKKVGVYYFTESSTL